MNLVLDVLPFATVVVSLLLVSFKYFMRPGVAGLLRRSTPAQWSLRTFLNLPEKMRESEKHYLFNEQSVFSMGHKFVGRFDQAVLHWKTGPILDLVVERKFPTRVLPERIKEHDMFQAGLYAVALMERGVSCQKTRLATIYCLQHKAAMCLEKKSATDCIRCGSGKVFVRKFRPSRVLKTLAKLDEVWFSGRKPRASPSKSKCRQCPHSKTHACKYVAL